MAHERILIVEDEAVFAEQLQMQLTKLGYQVCGIASSGDEALQKFDACRPQLALMDIHLSDDRMDGIDIAKKFRQRADIPIIFLTAHSDEQTVERAKSIMPFGYLLKPLRQHDVKNTIEIALHKHRLEKKLHKAHDELERRVQERTAELEQRNRELQQEILDRVTAETSLNQEQALLRTLMDTSPDHIYFKDRQFRFIRINKSMATWFGLKDPKEAIGKTDSEFFTEEHARQAAIDEEFVMESGRVLMGKEEKETWPDGHETWVSSAKVPLHNEQGHVVGTFGISRNITENKLAEAELQTYREHLEELVEERTIELQQEITERKQIEQQLQQARTEADASNKAKSEFLTNMSHELRTPLNGILGYTQILQQEPHLTDFQRSSLGTIERSGKHLLRLINEILDLSKIEAQKMELHETEVHFAGFLSGISEIIRIRAQQKGIAFRYETTSELPQFICTDERQLSQILLNLLSNAVKFTDTGGVSLKVGELRPHGRQWHEYTEPEKFCPEKRGSICIRFQVSDSGIGIPQSQLQEIFSPFTQIGDHTRRQNGTGLGLAISRQIARLMGSELHVRSASDKGSTFWFDLQLKKITQGHEHGESPHLRIRQLRGDAPTILVVDDKEENRMLLKDMLRPLGFLLLEAENGKEALEQTRAHHPKLILMDLIMPEMDGFEAVEQIRKEFDTRDIIIIAVSASAFEQTRQKSVAVGCHDFLSKPISSQELLMKLEHYLDLEWIYDDIPQISSVSSDLSVPAQTIVPPPKAELLQLYDLARIGDILKLRQTLNTFEKDEPDYTAFYSRLRQFSNELNIMKIQQFLEGYLKE